MKITSFILAFVGGYILLGSWELHYSMQTYETYMKRTYQHLQIIQKELKNYYIQHKHYPSNEEGLGKLDFPSKIPLTIYYYRNELRGFPDLFYSQNSYFWIDIPRYMENFYKENNRVPCNIEDLQDILWLELEPTKNEDVFVANVDFIATSNNFFASSKGEVFSFWLVPFIYENRNSFDPTIFEKFPHGQNNYSIEVAKNIYVYSVGSKYFYQKYYSLYIQTMFIFCLGLLITLTSFYIIIYSDIKNKKWLQLLFSILGTLFCIFIGIHFNMLNRPKCVAANYFYNRPEILPLYQKQIEYHRDLSIITVSRYQYLINACKFK